MSYNFVNYTTTKFRAPKKYLLQKKKSKINNLIYFKKLAKNSKSKTSKQGIKNKKDHTGNQ